MACVASAAASFTVGHAEAQTSRPGATVRGDLPSASEADAGYTSPYDLRFASAQVLLDAGFDRAPWNDPGGESDMPFAVWEKAHVGDRDAAWGPPARQYPAPRLPLTDAAYLRERVIAVAARHLGLGYQHHHVPSWPPPAGWPWRTVAAGANGRGLDCSNFTSFVFNYALGIKLPTAVGQQAWDLDLQGPGGAGCLRAAHVPIHGFEALGADLQPADLVFIRNRSGQVGHVVMWLGSVGQSPDGDPLVIDCTQSLHRDAGGVLIPRGVQLRPFRRTSWYWRRFSHAHRVIGAETQVCSAPRPSSEGGG
ncbi:MAG: hypothetical protein HIU92_06695 [Proteobacteria bacterium]|nr:hypothetical protein [Pseudomonadota bacterium]